MKRSAKILCAFLGVLLLASLGVQADQTEVRDLRVTSGPDQTKLVAALSGPISHRIFALQGPDRLVVDIANARLSAKLPASLDADPILIGLRSGVRDDGDLRIVLDLRRAARVKSFVLSPGEGEGYRLVIDLSPKSGNRAAGRQTGDGPVHSSVQSRKQGARKLVVAIDPGHGGEDPGAIGVHGAQEKNVTLAIAKRLAALVDKAPGMRAFLTRDGDYFVPLRRRIQKARKADADLFISIHADAFDDPRVGGSSVFTLSQRGASSEAAKWLADKENSADLVGGVDLGGSDDTLSAVLLDMAQNATLEQSGEAAQAVLGRLSRLGGTHHAVVQKAGFVVLKSPDIPSMLVETAFITNPDEEKRLASSAQQQRIAAAIMTGIEAYFRKYGPRGARLAESDDREPARKASSRAGKR